MMRATIGLEQRDNDPLEVLKTILFAVRLYVVVAHMHVQAVQYKLKKYFQDVWPQCN